MRILLLADRLSARGGADWHLLGIAGALVVEHDVSFVVGRRDHGVDAPCPIDVVPGLDARTAVPVDLDVVARTFRPDVVHLQNVVNPRALRWAADWPALATVQDHRFFCPFRGKWTAAGAVCTEPLHAASCAACFDDAAYFADVLALTTARLAALQRLRATVVLSRYMRGELVAAGCDPAAVHVIPPFVHGINATAAPSRAPCFLFVGRLVEPKGVRDAVVAWRRAGVAEPLVFAGTGPLRAELAKDAEVLGWLPHARLSGLLRSARAVIMPSRWQEPFGIAGLEALTAGTPVLAFRSGGIPEWHPGPGLVPWGDVDALSACLRALPPAPAVPSGFDQESLMRRLVELYRVVAGS